MATDGTASLTLMSWNTIKYRITSVVAINEKHE
jgi:hypothetical protein